MVEKVNSYLLKKKRASGYTTADIADILNCGESTVSAYFSGFIKPSGNIISRLAINILGIPTERAVKEFDKVFNQWGIDHPDYVRTGNSYVKRKNNSKCYIPPKEEQPEEEQPEEVQPDENPPVDISSEQPSWAEVECGDNAEVEDLITGPTYGELMEYLYNKVSFKDYVYVDSAKSSREILKYLYDKMDKDDFVDLVRFIFKF